MGDPPSKDANNNFECFSAESLLDGRPTQDPNSISFGHFFSVDYAENLVQGVFVTSLNSIRRYRWFFGGLEGFAKIRAPMTTSKD